MSESRDENPPRELVTGRCRLNVIEGLEVLSDPSHTDEALNILVESLVEDFCDLRAESIETGLDYVLADDAERTAARVALPLIERFYLDHEVLRQSDVPHDVRRSAGKLMAIMLSNRDAQADALREREEAGS